MKHDFQDHQIQRAWRPSSQSWNTHEAQAVAGGRRQAISALHTSTNTHLYSLDTVKSTTLVTQPLHDAPLVLLFISTYMHTFCSQPHTSLAARTSHTNSLHLHASPGPTSMHGAPPCHDPQDSASSGSAPCTWVPDQTAIHTTALSSTTT
jgi:hypothetical protein